MSDRESPEQRESRFRAWWAGLTPEQRSNELRAGHVRARFPETERREKTRNQLKAERRKARVKR